MKHFINVKNCEEMFVESEEDSRQRDTFTRKIEVSNRFVFSILMFAIKTTFRRFAKLA